MDRLNERDFFIFPGGSSQNGEKEAETVSGLVDQIIYKNDENGYVVCIIDDDSGRPVTATGTMPYLNEGDRIRATGEWITHKKYGRQFNVSYFEHELPAESSDMLRYLASGAIKGIGPKTAARIVEKFGNDTFDVIENHPEWLAQISGISQKKAESISVKFKEVSGSREFMIFSRDFFSPALSMKIYRAWGAGAVERIRRDPYSLCSEFGGIGFKRADSIAASLGLRPDSPQRIRAGLRYVLSNEASRNGHTCLPAPELLTCAEELLSDGVEMSAEIADELVGMVKRKQIVSYSSGGLDFFFLPQYFEAETVTAKKLVNLDRMCPAFSDEDISALISEAEGVAGVKYADLQIKALATALKSGVMVLTGGPGTGKTTIIKGLIHIFEAVGMTVALAAPTGRAAKRMSEATSCEARTIHRLLEMEYSETDAALFLRNENDPLDDKVIIIDEASMIDTMLMSALVRAIRRGSRLILIGDADQLPSVGCGNVLSDVIASGAFPVIELTEIFRQSSGSGITVNAHRINNGMMPDFSSVGRDFFFLKRDSDAAVAECVRDLIIKRLPKTYGRSVIDRIQVITPSRKGRAGTESLNDILRSALNPSAEEKKEFVHHGVVFREGDRVMQTKNDYSVEWTDPFDNTGYGVFNGDIGTISNVSVTDEEAAVCFDEKTCKYDFSSFDEMEHAYAITVHKSQGSEYPIVIIPLFDCPPMLKTRNLLYTAITRASKMVILVGRPEVVAQMVANGKKNERCTMLRPMIEIEASSDEG